jgi:gas vesicle protein
MSEKQGFSLGQITLAFLGGAAAGAAVAVLTTPQSGEQTRQQLGRYARRGKERVEHLPERAQEAMDSASHAARDAFESALAKARLRIAPH